MTLEIFDTTEQTQAFTTDILIVGAGAAGITLARRLRGRGLKIMLIESGGADYNKQTQALYEGTNSGEEYYNLDESRLRFFGGTTAIWGGRCAQLDPIDFEKRPWVAHSGWPIEKQTLLPYYHEAQKALGLPSTDGNIMPGFSDPLKDGRVRTAFWQFDEKFSRFTLPACSDLKEAEDVRILLQASLIALNTNENGQCVTSARIANLKGGAADITAGIIILAAGGLENPRLLLTSRTKAHPDGVGNNSDQVGRYFMEHPHGRAAQILSDTPKALFQRFPSFLRDKRKNRYGLLLRPDEKTQRGREILNTCFTFGVFRHPGQEAELYRKAYNKIKHDMAPGGFGRGLWSLVKSASRAVQDRIGAQLKARALKNPKYGIYTVMRAEQAPNPDSRVRLSTDKDALGMPRVDLDWQFLDIDKHSVTETMRAFDEDLKDLGLGRVELADWLEDKKITWQFDNLVTSHVKGGYHHIGTTRMGDDPNTSVVDSDCRVHGIDNLYIMGSSVFPTGGWANPTLTILALALRLGDHIELHKR